MAILIFTGGILGTLFYWYPFRASRAQSFMLEQQVEEEKTEKAALQRLYEKLKDKYKSVEADRDNLLVQAQQLNAAKEAFSITESELKNLSAKHQDLLDKYQALEDEFGPIQLQAQSLQSSLDAATAESSSSKEIMNRISKENAEIKLELEQSSGKMDALKKETEELRVFEEGFMGLSASYDKLKEEKEALEKQVRNLPKKFSKMAHENKTLVRESGDMHYNLGVFYAKEKRYDRALPEFKKAVDINPTDSKALYNIGYIYAEQYKDREKAEYYFQRFLELTPDDPNADAVKNYLIEWEVFNSNVLKS